MILNGSDVGNVLIAERRRDYESLLEATYKRDQERQMVEERLRTTQAELEEEIVALCASAAADAVKRREDASLLEAAYKRDQERQEVEDQLRATQAELKEETAALSALLVAEAEKRKQETELLFNKRDQERGVELEEIRKRIAEAERKLSTSRAAEIRARDEILELKSRMSVQQRRLDEAQLELQAHIPQLAFIPSLVLIPSHKAPLSFPSSPCSPRLFPLLPSPLKPPDLLHSSFLPDSLSVWNCG